MNTLRGRLIATFLVVALTAVAIVGFFAVNRSRRAVIDSAWKEGQALASDLSNKIDAYLRERSRAIEIQAESPAVRSMDWAQQEPALNLLFDHYDFLDIFVANPDGTVRSLKLDAHGVNVKDRDYFIRAVREKKSTISDPIVNRATGTLDFAYASPIIVNGSVVGVLVALEALETIAKEVGYLKWGQSGYAVLTDSKGVILAHPVADVVGVLNASVEGDRIAPELAQAMRSGLEGQAGTTSYRFNNRDQMNAYAPIPFTGWLAMVTTLRQEFLIPVMVLQKIIIIVSVILALVVIIVSFFFANSIARPVKAIEHRMESLAEGDLASPLVVKSSISEVKNLAASIEKTLKSFIQILRGIDAQSNQVAASSEEMTATSDQTAIASEEIAKTIEEMAKGASDQARDTEQGAKRVDELGALIEQESLDMEKLNQSADEVVRLKDEGAQSLELLLEKTKESNEASNEIFDIITETNKSAEGIKAASGVIKSIADQTNLLALNAAIEAARAGEHGRGFAVVAEEVRKLAEQSNSSVHEIESIIKELITKTNKAVTTMNEVKAIVLAQTECVDGSMGKFEGIARAIEKTREAIGQLNLSGQEMDRKKSEIIEVIRNLSAIAQENAAGSEEAAASIEEQTAAVQEIANANQELAKLAEEMQAGIKQFRF